MSFYSIVGQALVGRVSIDLSLPFGVIMGVAFWAHMPWARTLSLVLGWGCAAILILLCAMGPFVPLKLIVGNTVLPNPSPLQIGVFVACLAPLVWFTLAVLHSKKAQEEFAKPAPLPS